MRFITVSLLFMFAVFYEMSGGADFIPPSQRTTQSAGAAEAATPTVQMPQSDTAVTRAAISPAIDGLRFARTDSATGDAKVIRASAGTTPAPAPAPEKSTAAAPAKPRNIGEGTLKVLALTGPAENAAADTAAQDATVTPASVPAPDPRDIRQVSGTRVNMRNGPGTNFGVLSQLAEGDLVEVLRDNGNGWVKLRTEGSGRIGWMAASLLTPVN